MAKNNFQVEVGLDIANKVQPFLYTGAIVSTLSTTVPTGWLACDGSAVSQTTYAALYAAIGTTYNTTGEGAGNFRLPSLANSILIPKSTTSGTIVSSAHTHSSNATLASSSTYNNTNADSSAFHNHTTNYGTNNQSTDHAHGVVDAGANGNTNNNPVNANKTGTATTVAGAGHVHTIGANGNTGNTNEAISHSHSGNASVDYGNFSHNHAGSVTLTTTSASSTFLPLGITARFIIKV
jgi:microcystin-dependent protein